MATRTKTVWFAFDTLTTALATSTTLGGATEHEFAARTVELPDLASPVTFGSVTAFVHAHDASTSGSTSFDGMRVAVQFNGGGYNVLDQTATGPNTGANWSHKGSRNLTDFFNANWTGTSRDVQIKVAFETSAVSNVINVSCLLCITYEWDDTAATFVKSLWLPIESITGTLTASLAEIGTNQIPAFDTLLPEAGKTFLEKAIVFLGQDGGVGGSPDFGLAVALDAESEVARAVLEHALGTGNWVFDIWRRSDLDTSVVHALKARSTTASTFPLFGAEVLVTYKYTKPTPSAAGGSINHVTVPLVLDSAMIPDANGVPVTNRTVFKARVYIPEANPVLKQSGLVTFMHINFSGGIENLYVGAQSSAGRDYNSPTMGAVSGPFSFVHRIDAGGALGASQSLVQGWNEFTINIVGTSSFGQSCITGYLRLNYVSDVDVDGEGAHNHTTWWCLLSTMENTMGGASRLYLTTTDQQTPDIPETLWALSCDVGYEFLTWGIVGAVSSTFGMDAMTLRIKRVEGSLGWVSPPTLNTKMDGETCQLLLYPTTDQFLAWNADPNVEHLNPEASREYFLSGGGNNERFGLHMLLTYQTADPTGTAPAGSGGAGLLETGGVGL